MAFPSIVEDFRKQTFRARVDRGLRVRVGHHRENRDAYIDLGDIGSSDVLDHVVEIQVMALALLIFVPHALTSCLISNLQLL